MDATITVRWAQVKDAEAIAQVHVDSWRTTYAGIIGPGVLNSLSVERRSAFWHEQLETASDRRLNVAETASGKIVGFSSFGPNREIDEQYQGEIYGLYLLKTYQRCGIGRRLVQVAATELRSRDIASLLVWVLAANPARKFYERLGGVYVRRQKVEIGEQVLDEVAYGWPDTETLTVLQT
jgi:ribosomal protein S18 acetylase RimI-like enzyme